MTLDKQRFAARYRDWDTGLYYQRNRWYDAGTGRFLSEDPIGLAGGINPYAYADNNPIDNTDPFGLCVGDWGPSRGDLVLCGRRRGREPVSATSLFGPFLFASPAPAIRTWVVQCSAGVGNLAMSAAFDASPVAASGRMLYGAGRVAFRQAAISAAQSNLLLVAKSSSSPAVAGAHAWHSAQHMEKGFAMRDLASGAKEFAANLADVEDQAMSAMWNGIGSPLASGSSPRISDFLPIIGTMYAAVDAYHACM